MRQRIGRFLVGVFAAASIAVGIAQTTYPTPYTCTEAYLRATYGDDWHVYYFLFGCWLIGADAPVSAAPREAFAMNRLRMR